ncbi:MAG: hypothetical protein KPI85_07965 [cyanobacterium endosymbiont of Epithemia adnata isolate EadnSB Bon19]
MTEQVSEYCDQILISDDHAEVSDAIARLKPSAIFGTQMERNLGKPLGIPCGVINCLAYSYSFTLGMEANLLEIFWANDTKEVITKEIYTNSDLN